MGADDLLNQCKPVHAVTVSSFWLAETPVTNAQYRPFVQASGKKPKYWDGAKYNQDLQPVGGVTWHDATAYCATPVVLRRDRPPSTKTSFNRKCAYRGIVNTQIARA